jgi:hypothetical protein
MTSPAKELVAHFEKEYKPDNGPAFYRGLVLKLNKARGYQFLRFELHCEPGSEPCQTWASSSRLLTRRGLVHRIFVFSSFEGSEGR